jgi:hypothetical protein
VALPALAAVAAGFFILREVLFGETCELCQRRFYESHHTACVCVCVCAKIVCVSISTHCELMEQIYIAALASAATIWHMRKSTFKRHVTRLNFNR